MSELAFNLNGDPSDVPTNAVGWRAQDKNAAPEVAYGRMGPSCCRGSRGTTCAPRSARPDVTASIRSTMEQAHPQRAGRLRDGARDRGTAAVATSSALALPAARRQ
jgi:hypothetical protein